MCFTILMEVHFPTRKSFACALVILGIVIVQALYFFSHVVVNRVPRYTPRLLLEETNDNNDTTTYEQLYLGGNNNTSTTPIPYPKETAHQIINLGVTSFPEMESSSHVGNSNYNTDADMKKATNSIHSSCEITNSIGFNQVDNRQYRSFHYMFNYMPIERSTISSDTKEISVDYGTSSRYDQYYHGSNADDDDDDDGVAFTEKFAVCDFVIDQFAFHFPHTMQQLYRCWSWWRFHDEAIPVLIFPHSNLPTNAFINGFLSALQEIIELEILKPSDIDEIGLSLNENGTLVITSDIPQMDSTLISYVRPRLPPNLVDPKNLFGMDDPTCTYYSFHSIDDARVLRDMFLEYLVTNTSSTNLLDEDEGDLGVSRLNGIMTTFPDAQNKTEVETSTLHTISPTQNKRIVPRISILNRLKSRQLQNAEDIASKLQQVLLGMYNNKENVEIVYFNENTTFHDQIQFFSSNDIIISPHGAQLTGIPFMPNCGVVFELFPSGYYLPFYFGSLASASGLYHGFTMSTNDTNNWRVEAARGMKDRKSRQSIRNHPLCIDPDIVVNAIQHLLSSWESCHNRQT